MSLLERRIKRIRRWIDRCAAACERRLWASAIAELDCARAELEETRRALGDHLASEPLATGAASPALRVALTALLLLPLLSHPAGLPLGRENSLPPLFTASGSIVEIVTADEKLLLDSLRSPGGNPTARAVEAETEVAREASSAAEPGNSMSEGVSPGLEAGASPLTEAPRVARAGGESSRSGEISETPKKDASSGKLRSDGELPAEEILRLLQVGQRALEGESAVVVIR